MVGISAPNRAREAVPMDDPDRLGQRRVLDWPKGWVVDDAEDPGPSRADHRRAGEQELMSEGHRLAAVVPVATIVTSPKDSAAPITSPGASLADGHEELVGRGERDVVGRSPTIRARPTSRSSGRFVATGLKGSCGRATQAVSPLDKLASQDFEPIEFTGLAVDWRSQGDGGARTAVDDHACTGPGQGIA
jgi:hypothetical protein